MVSHRNVRARQRCTFPSPWGHAPGLLEECPCPLRVAKSEIKNLVSTDIILKRGGGVVSSNALQTLHGALGQPRAISYYGYIATETPV